MDLEEIPLTEKRIVEKLIILNDHGHGLLIRVYNIKKSCEDTNSKPKVFMDKSLESSIKSIVKKFPNSSGKGLDPIMNVKVNILKTLSTYFYTFVDVLDFKNEVCELLSTMDKFEFYLDLTINFELTRNYLELVVTYVSLMKLVSHVEDRKALVGLYNVAYVFENNKPEQNYLLLAQLIIDYTVPLKRLIEDFTSYQRVLSIALKSLAQIYPLRSAPLNRQKLSLIEQEDNVTKPECANNALIKILPLETIDRWIIFGLMLSHQTITQSAEITKMWEAALEQSWVITLFRDEVIQIHQFIQNTFDGIKSCSKRISELKDAFNVAIQKSSNEHYEKRTYLRAILKEMTLILNDKPGLIGPKAPLILTTLSLSRDEVVWLLRHTANPPSGKNKHKSTIEFEDRQLPELLFYMEELRILLRKYSQIIKRYYIQYLSGYDATDLNLQIQSIKGYGEEDGKLLSSLHQTAVNLTLTQVENDGIFDFRCFRLNWYRLQTYMSIATATVHIKDNSQLACLLNSMVVHTRIIDNIDQLIIETSDLSIYCFYGDIFEDHFNVCLQIPSQSRCSIAFPIICSHFENCTHELCPEEQNHIQEYARSIANNFLEAMAEEAKNIAAIMCEEQCIMASALLPKTCVKIFSLGGLRKKRKTQEDHKVPGWESYRSDRENLSKMDKLLIALTEICFAINFSTTIKIWKYMYYPREYLCQQLRNYFSRAIVGKVQINDTTMAITKPSELLIIVRAHMSTLKTIESYVNIDVTKILRDCLLQQTQLADARGGETLTTLYNSWYTEELLRRVGGGHIVFSLSQRTFISITQEGCIPFNPQEFSDLNELRALAELIGPYGIKILNEKLMRLIASQVQGLKNLVDLNKDVLIALRTNFDNPELMQDQMKHLQNDEDVLRCMTIIGVILCFRNLVNEALVDVLEQRIPFLLNPIKDVQNHLKEADKIKIASELACAAGLPCKVDPILINVLKSGNSQIEDHLTACLLMVFVAVSIPKLARMQKSFYHFSLGANSNNIHCMAVSINTFFGALFTICDQNDTAARMREFLKLASSSLLNLGVKSTKEVIHHPESVYLLLHQIVEHSSFLTMNELELCFPYALIRNAFYTACKKEAIITNQTRSMNNT